MLSDILLAQIKAGKNGLQALQIPTTITYYIDI